MSSASGIPSSTINTSIIANLPGVQEVQAQTQKAVLSNDITLALDSVDRGSSPAVAQQQSTLRQQELASDLAANEALVDALKDYGFNPTPAALDRVCTAAKQNPVLFTALVNAATTMSLTMGKSEGAKQEFATALANFMEGANVRRTDTADVAYLMARIMLSTDKTEREASMKAMQAALEVTKQQLADLEKQRDDLNRYDSSGKLTDTSGGKLSFEDGVLVMKTGEGEIMPVKQDPEMLQAKKDSLDKRIDDLKDTIKTLTAQMSKETTATLANDPLAIMLMLEMTKSMASSGFNMNNGGNSAGNTAAGH